MRRQLFSVSSTVCVCVCWTLFNSVIAESSKSVLKFRNANKHMNAALWFFSKIMSTSLTFAWWHCLAKGFSTAFHVCHEHTPTRANATNKNKKKLFPASVLAYLHTQAKVKTIFRVFVPSPWRRADGQGGREGSRHTIRFTESI